MAAKPSTRPRWANVGGAIVVPPSGKLDVGHVPAEKPPAQHENWFKNLTWQWIEYLGDGVFAGGHTFTGETVFEDTVEIQQQLEMTGGTITGAGGARAPLGGIENSGATRDNGNQLTTNTASTPVHDFALADNCTLLFMQAAAGADDFTGMTGGVQGRYVEIWNSSITNEVIIAHANAGSAAANRFICSTGADISLTPGKGVRCRYFNGWRTSPL